MAANRGSMGAILPRPVADAVGPVVPAKRIVKGGAAIWFGGEGAGSTLATGTGCSSDSVEVDLVGLGSFVVDNRVYAFDI